VRATAAVAAGLLEETAMEADCAPLAVGANWTRSVQVELGASAGPQLLSCVKEAAPVPLRAMEVRFSGVVALELARVTDCTAWPLLAVREGKLRVVDESVSVGALPPVPLSATVWEVGEALSVKTRVADLLPVAVGAKRIRAVQLAAAASEAGQLFICVKEVGLVPPRAMEERAKGALPELVRVRAWAGL